MLLILLFNRCLSCWNPLWILNSVALSTSRVHCGIFLSGPPWVQGLCTNTHYLSLFDYLIFLFSPLNTFILKITLREFFKKGWGELSYLILPAISHKTYKKERERERVTSFYQQNKTAKFLIFDAFFLVKLRSLSNIVFPLINHALTPKDTEP